MSSHPCNAKQSSPGNDSLNFHGKEMNLRIPTDTSADRKYQEER
jgi:hypothetical protein